MIQIVKLDWSITSPEERLQRVNEILEEVPNPNLELLATYLVESKDRKILTDNRLATINRRETSLEGLIDQGGEDGIYNIIVESNKNAIFIPKISITKKDLEEIPPLRQKRNAINFWENQLKTATGHNAFVIKQTIIELRKDQYIIKDFYRQRVKATNVTRNLTNYVILPSAEWVDETDTVCYSGASLCDKRIIEQILLTYQSLKSNSRGRFLGDTYYLLEDFDRLYDEAMAPYPMYRRLVEYRIDGYSNSEVQQLLYKEFGVLHTIPHISQLLHNKIPNIIAEKAQENYLLWYHTFVVKSKWRRCTKCGEVKLAHRKFFSINKTSKEGLYSICKACRGRKKNGTVLLPNMREDNGG